LIKKASAKFNQHPKGLFHLFFAEMWERFSFYGMRALLVLYMTLELGFTDSKAYGVYAAYFTLVYATTLLGGIVADRILGNQKAITIGGILITIGHLVLTLTNLYAFYIGLAFVIAGTGLFKANISTLLGQLYDKSDPRRDSGFTIFYMGINLGALLASLVCGYVGETFGWHYGFGLASIGMLSGLVTFLRGLNNFGSKGLPPKNSRLNDKTALGISREYLIYILSFLSVPLFAYFMMHENLFDQALPLFGVIVLSWLFVLTLKAKKEERASLLVIFVLMFFQVAFFSLFEQAGSSMTLFTERHVNRAIAGFTLTSSQFQALNPLFILLFGPVFSWLWTTLGKKNRDPYPPAKFILALIQVASGFLVLKVGINLANLAGYTSASWLVLAYFLHTTGEICLSPVGLSLVTKLAPQRLLSTLMGVWFLSIAFANHLAGIFAKMSSVETIEGHINNTFDALQKYEDTFSTIMSFAFIMALILLIISPFLNRVFKNIEAKTR